MGTADVMLGNISNVANAPSVQHDQNFDFNQPPTHPKSTVSSRNYTAVSPAFIPPGVSAVKKDIVWDFWTTIVRRLTGTLAGQLAGRSVEEAYHKNAEERFNTPLHRVWKNIGKAIDKSTEFFSGSLQHEYEITKIGEKHLNAVQRLRHDINKKEEVDDKGWFRPRFYNLSAEQVKALEDQEEATYGKPLPAEEKATQREKLDAMYDELKKLGKHNTYGHRNMVVSHDFAVMGLTDFTTNLLLKRGREGLDILSKMSDPAWRKSKEFEDFKHNFNLGGFFKGFVKPIAEDFFRGDGWYDYMIGFFPFPGVMTSLGLDYVSFKEKYQRQGSTEKDSPLTRSEKLFNVPFVVYNMLGPVIREMMWDPFFNKEKSALRKHLDYHKPPEGTGFFRRLFNNVFQIGNYMAMRTYQICVQMFPAVMIFFSPLRHYGMETKKELFSGRQDLLNNFIRTELGVTAEAAADFKSFKEDLDIKGKHEEIVNKAAAPDAGSKLKTFFADYMKGKYDIKLAEEDNTRIDGKKFKPGSTQTDQDKDRVKFDRKIAGIEVGGLEKSVTQFKDLIGNHGVKPFTKKFAATFQKLIINQLEANPEKFEKTTAADLERLIILTERWAAAYLPYMIYFEAKRMFGNISQTDKLLNLPTTLYQEMTATLQAVISGNTLSGDKAKETAEHMVSQLLGQTMPGMNSAAQEAGNLSSDQNRQAVQNRSNISEPAPSNFAGNNFGSQSPQPAM